MEALLCLAMAAMADLSEAIVARLDFSSALNSASSFLRIAVAESRASEFLAISFSRLAISVFNLALLAVKPSMAEVRSLIDDSESAIDFVFALSFVVHQHPMASYTSSS